MIRMFIKAFCGCGRHSGGLSESRFNKGRRTRPKGSAGLLPSCSSLAFFQLSLSLHPT